MKKDEDTILIDTHRLSDPKKFRIKKSSIYLISYTEGESGCGINCLGNLEPKYRYMFQINDPFFLKTRSELSALGKLVLKFEELPPSERKGFFSPSTYEDVLKYNYFYPLQSKSADWFLRQLGPENFRELPQKILMEFFEETGEPIQGYYRPKIKDLAPKKDKRDRGQKKQACHNDSRHAQATINQPDLEQLITKIVSEVIDRLFATGLFSASRDNKPRITPQNIQDAEIVFHAAEEACKSLVPVSKQKQVKDLVLRKISKELMKRE